MKSTRRSAPVKALSGMMKFSISQRYSSVLSAVCCCLAMAAVGMLLPTANAEDTTAGASEVKAFAQLPYQQLVTIARNNSSNPTAKSSTDDKEDGKAEEDKGDEDKPAPLMLKVSSSRGVPAEQIRLLIMRASGPVSIPIQANGDFEVPWSQEIFDENPMVVSNLPKETMNLNFTIAIPEVRPKVVDGKVRYQSLFTQLLEAQKEIRKTNPDFGKPGFDTLAIQIVGGGKGVAIERSLGTRTIQPDTAGDVWMVYDLLLFEENPSVTLPEKAAVNIVPVDARDSLRIRTQ